MPDSPQFLLTFTLTKVEWMTKDPINCWISTFQTYLEAKSVMFPLALKSEFLTKPGTWLTTTPEGFKAQADKLVGVVDGQIVYIAISSVVEVGPFDPIDDKLPYYDHFQAFLEKKMEEAH